MAIRINVKSFVTKAGRRVKPFVRHVKATAKKPRPLPASGRVRLKTSRQRRVVSLNNTQEWSDVLSAKKGLPPGIKVEHRNLKNNKRLPKKYKYESSDASSVYTHGTRIKYLKPIKKSGVINIATKRTLYGNKVYLEKLPAHKNNYGDTIFEFPEAKLKPRGLEIVSNDLKIHTLPEALPISEASKLLIKNNYKRRKDGTRVNRNVKIRYKKHLTKLISFSRKLRNGRQI